MNKSGIISAVIAALIALTGALVTLWSQGDIKYFADVSEVAYGVAGMSALAAGLTAYKARMADKPE